MKKFKTKHKSSHISFFIIIIIISFFLTFHFLKTNFSNITVNQSKMIKYLLASGFNNQITNYRYSNPLDITYPLELIQNCLNFKFDHTIKTPENTLKNMEETNSKVKEPLIYIYNTHDEEAYFEQYSQGYNITPNVKMASYMLQEKLEDNGLLSIVETTSISGILKENDWSYASSYKASRLLLDTALKTYPSLNYFIDIHRDSSLKEKTTLQYDNKNYAQMLFIVGMENPNYEANLTMAQDLSKQLNASIANISKGIYKKEGPGVNGVYNQDISSNALLIEIGGQENTIDEVANSINILADNLYKYIRGENYEKEKI